jgi:putative addiction module killer protein
VLGNHKAGLFGERLEPWPGYRVYFTRRGQTVVILLCGGEKRTQSKDIRKAMEIAEALED